MSTYRIVFDLDDTLYPERQFALSGFRAAGAWARERYGVEGLADEMADLLDSGHLGAVFKISLGRADPDYSEADLAQFVECYRSHTPEIDLYDDAESALSFAMSLGPIGLITDGTHSVQRSKVQALGIASRFSEIIYTNELGGREFHKPHPRAYELMELHLGGDDVTLVYVGDNPSKDFVTPNANGWLSVQIEREQRIHHNAQVADGGAPHHVVQSLAELASLFR